MEDFDLPLLSEHDTAFFELEMTDWSERLGFDPALYGVDVGMGTVDGKRIGLMTAMVCAIARHETWQHIEEMRERFGSSD